MKIRLRAFLVPIIAMGCALLSDSSMGADKFTIGASLLTSQHPFYVLLANAMKEEAAKDGVDLNLTIANQDLSKPVSFKKIRLKNELKAWEAASPQDRIRFDEQLPT